MCRPSRLCHFDRGVRGDVEAGGRRETVGRQKSRSPPRSEFFVLTSFKYSSSKNGASSFEIPLLPRKHYRLPPDPGFEFFSIHLLAPASPAFFADNTRLGSASRVQTILRRKQQTQPQQLRPYRFTFLRLNRKCLLF